MNIKDILTKHGVADEQVATVEEALAKEKVYLTKEENIDVRYNKLKEQFDSKNEELDKANGLVAELQKSTGDNDKAQKQITDYKTEIDTLKAKIADGEKKTIATEALKQAGVSDVDYALYKLGGVSSLELKDGEIADMSNLVKDLKKSIPDYFKESTPTPSTPENNGGYKPVDNGLKQGNSGTQELSLSEKIANNMAKGE